MAKPRKRWRVTQGWLNGVQADPGTEQVAVSQAKVYEVHIPEAVAAARADDEAGRHRYDFTDVWVDERDGQGWQRYERIVHTQHPLWGA